MKTMHKTILVSFFFGTSVWVIDATLDSLLEHQQPFLESLLTNVPTHQVCIRGAIIAAFLIFGYLAGKSLTAHELARASLRAAQALLEQAGEEQELRIRRRTSELAASNIALTNEIAARKEVQNALVEQSRHLEAFFKYSVTPFAFLDKDFTIIRVNEAYARACRLNVPELIGRNHRGSCPPHVKTAFEHAIAEKSPYQAVAQPLRISGDSESGTTYWDWSLVPILDGEGDVDFLVFSLRDVTERQRAENALRESEQLLSVILASLPVGVWVTDGEGKIVMGNPAGREIWAGARFVGLDRYAEYKGWRADTGQPMGGEDWALARAFRKGETSLNEVLHIQSFDGARKTILNSAVPIRDAGGKITRAIVVNQDITAIHLIEEQLKVSEAQLRQSNILLQKVFDGISDPLVMLGVDLSVKMLNKAARGFYAVGSADLKGKPCYEAFRGRSEPCPECQCPQAVARGQATTFERKGVKDPGRDEQVVVYPVLDETGTVDSAIIRISDITQAKSITRQLIHREKLAALGLLVSGMAHEINNPNTFISFNIPILRDYIEAFMPFIDEHAANHPDLEFFRMPYQEFRQDIFKLLDNMQYGSDRINAIVSNLKRFARNSDSPVPAWIDLRVVIDRAVAFCNTEIKKRVNSFQVQMPEDLPKIHGNEEVLEQILINLLINAVHASDKQDSRIRLAVTHGESWGRHCVIEVSDNGCGIEEEIRNRIFDPFFTTKSSESGTGLGLYVCYNLIQSIGGSIEVSSEPGKGSAFRVVLHGAERRSRKREDADGSAH